jgi:hypothetical protein
METASRSEMLQAVLLLPIFAWFGALVCVAAAVVWTAAKVMHLFRWNGESGVPFAISGY